MTLRVNAGTVVAEEDNIAEPQHDVLAVAERLKGCGRASLEAVLLAAIVSQKIGVEDLRPTSTF